MDFPNTPLTKEELENGPFAGGRNYEHYVVERKDSGLKMVSLAGYFRAMGIPKLTDAVKVAKFLAGSKAKVTWEADADYVEYKEAA